MSTLRLYKDFYFIAHSPSNSADTYTFIDPISVSASTTVYGNNTIIESIVLVNESTGRYYADLNPYLYSTGIIYEITWQVIYVSNSPLKSLKTRFKLVSNITNIGSGLEIQLLKQNDIEIEVNSPTYGIDIEIISASNT